MSSYNNNRINNREEDENAAYNDPWPQPMVNSGEVYATLEELNNANNNNNNNQNNNNRHERQFTDIVSDAINRPDVQSWLLPYASIFTIGGGIGFATGVTAKKMGSVVLKTGIGSLLIVQALSYKGYITINWDNMKQDINQFMQQQQSTNVVQFLVTNIGPVLAGFGLGFHLG